MAFTSVISNQYLQNNKRYLVKIPNSIEVSFFGNTEPLTTPAFANLRLGIFNAYGSVQLNVAPLQKIDLGGGSYRVYVESLTITGLVEGSQYLLAIYDEVTQLGVMAVYCFEYVQNPEPYTYLSYRHSSDIFDYNYEDLPTYRNKIFVDLNQLAAPAEYNITSFVEEDTGDVRQQESEVRYNIILEGTLFDNIASDAMKGFSIHDDILINGRRYQVTEPWEQEEDPITKRNSGTITVTDQTYNEINLNL